MAYTQVFVFSKWVEFQGFLLSCLSVSFGCFFKLKKYIRRGALLDILCQGKQAIFDALTALVKAKSIVHFKVKSIKLQFVSNLREDKKLIKTFFTSRIKLSFSCGEFLLKKPVSRSKTFGCLPSKIP